MSQSACGAEHLEAIEIGVVTFAIPLITKFNKIESARNSVCVCDKAVLIFYVFLLDMVSARACGFIRMPANIGLYGIPSAIRPLFV